MKSIGYWYRQYFSTAYRYWYFLAKYYYWYWRQFSQVLLTCWLVQTWPDADGAFFILLGSHLLTLPRRDVLKKLKFLEGYILILTGHCKVIWHVRSAINRCGEVHTDIHTRTHRLIVIFQENPGQPVSSLILIEGVLKQEVFTSRNSIDLLVAQPAASKHWRQCCGEVQQWKSHYGKYNQLCKIKLNVNPSTRYVSHNIMLVAAKI